MSLRRPAVTALCGTVAVAGWLVLAHIDVASFRAAAAPLDGTAEVAPVEPAKSEHPGSRNDSATGAATVPASVPAPQPAPPAAAAVPDPASGAVPQTTISVEAFDEWVLSENGIDEYLWSLYQRTPKLDMAKVSQRVRVTARFRGKTRTITRTSARLVLEDFAWKDPDAAEKVGMSLTQYVIGGMDPNFRLRLYRMLRAMDDAGLMPGITSAFRDDYRQAIATGRKASGNTSYHGGSGRGGYGHGLAADLVSVKGENRAERLVSSGILWQWIDAHGREYGIGRPYLNRDPPHVGPIDGEEYAAKRGRGKAKLAGSGTHKANAPRGNNNNNNNNKQNSNPNDAKTASQ
jgi:hypothetical protein